MRQRVRILLAVLAVGVLTGAGVTPAAGGGAAQPDLRAAVSAQLRAGLGAQASAAYGAAAAAGLETLVEPKRMSADRNWAFGGAVFLVPSGVEAGPITALFVANRKGGAWNVALEGTAEFADLSHRAPSSVVKQSERTAFARTAAAAAPLAETGLALPWKQGTGWGHWGVHGNSGQPRPWNSIDFFGGDGRVLTARAGTMYRFCTSGGRWPYIKVIHDNGYTTGYYHLRDTTTKGDGGAMALGEYVGMIDVQLPCGGSANGNHVHWTLWQGNTAIPVQGKTIGGWTWFDGASAYQGYAERGGTRIFRNNCCPIINYGGGGDPGGKYFENTANVDIADLGTAESSITVSGVSGNAPARLQVFQDVHHTWRGDLRIDLIGPSGRAYRLRDPDPDDDADVIHETDYVDASSETANGVWKMRVTDVSTNDSGYIDAWNLTF